jgi:dipeptidyl aminopeptidase/acylaminoacyl peptidase
MRHAVLAAVFASATTSAVLGQGRAFTPQDWYRLTTVSSPAVSPDGKWIAFQVTTVREAENKRHAEVWLVAADGGAAPTRMTSPSVESSAPRWSPDGRLLLFSSTRPGSKARTWGLRMDRSAGEAFEVDSVPAGSVTKDGRTIVWSDTVEITRDSTKKDKDPYEKMPPMARPPFGAITAPIDPARFDGRHVVDFPYKINGTGFVPNRKEARRWNPRQIWSRSLDGGPKRQVTETNYSHHDAQVSPDGQWIAFVADARLRPDSVVQAERDSLGRLPYDAKRDESPRNDQDIFLMPAAGGPLRRLTTQDGNEGGLAWSPDGSRLAFVSAATRTGSARLSVVAVSGGPPVNLLGTWAYEPQWFQWLPNGEILLNAAVGGRDAFFQLDPGPKTLRESIGGRRKMPGVSLDPGGTVLAFVSTGITKPTELFTANPNGTGERQLTRFNETLNSEIAWPDAERFTYRSVGGLEIEAWLQRPFGYQPGRKYPLVLYIHGGPHAAYGENWFDEFHSISGAGMWVLFTNPRGSGSYGGGFTYSTRGRWGAEDYQDLMKAVDIVAVRPDVDSTRMGVSGGSYGGYMTAWVTTKTSRFKAAETDRMISNWWSWYGASDAQGLTEFEFYGKPWDNPAIYDSLSPIRFVKRVTTPTLLVQSEEDHRTPIADAEQWFMALKKRGIPAEFVRYPRSNHDLSRTGEPWLLVDRLGRIRQWFTHWLAGGTATTAGR